MVQQETSMALIHSVGRKYELEEYWEFNKLKVGNEDE